MSRFKRFALASGVAFTSLTAVTSLAACGFVGASDKSAIKPGGFLLYGHASVILPADDHRANGASCTAPTSVTDVVSGAKVTILDPDGKTLAIGALADGIVAHVKDVPTCDFSFSIPAVSGGVDTYGVQIGTRPAQQFPAQTLRQNAPAVITVTP